MERPIFNTLLKLKRYGCTDIERVLKLSKVIIKQFILSIRKRMKKRSIYKSIKF